MNDYDIYDTRMHGFKFMTVANTNCEEDHILCKATTNNAAVTMEPRLCE